MKSKCAVRAMVTLASLVMFVCVMAVLAVICMLIGYDEAWREAGRSGFDDISSEDFWQE